jgi:hypothetical protein
MELKDVKIKLSDLDELNKRVSNLEKENIELKKMFKDVLKHGDYQTVQFILSIVKSNRSRL